VAEIEVKDVLALGNKCSICEVDYDEEEGGVQGYFGILPVTFCCWCYSCLVDMLGQLETPEDDNNN
jgi:hypothetical protein